MIQHACLDRSDVICNSSLQHYSKTQLGCEPKSTTSLKGSHLSSLNRPEQRVVFAAQRGLVSTRTLPSLLPSPGATRRRQQKTIIYSCHNSIWFIIKYLYHNIISFCYDRYLKCKLDQWYINYILLVERSYQPPV